MLFDLKNGVFEKAEKAAWPIRRRRR